jgi:hypothetical protein
MNSNEKTINILQNPFQDAYNEAKCQLVEVSNVVNKTKYLIILSSILSIVKF